MREQGLGEDGNGCADGGGGAGGGFGGIGEEDCVFILLWVQPAPSEQHAVMSVPVELSSSHLLHV